MRICSSPPATRSCAKFVRPDRRCHFRDGLHSQTACPIRRDFEGTRDQEIFEIKRSGDTTAVCDPVTCVTGVALGAAVAVKVGSATNATIAAAETTPRLVSNRRGLRRTRVTGPPGASGRTWVAAAPDCCRRPSGCQSWPRASGPAARRCHARAADAEIGASRRRYAGRTCPAAGIGEAPIVDLSAHSTNVADS